MRKLGRSFRTLILLIIIMFALVGGAGILLKNVVNYEDTAPVVVYKMDIPKGELMKPNEINDFMEVITMPRAKIPPTAMTSLGGFDETFISENVYTGEFVTQNTLSIENPFHVNVELEEGNSLVSLKFDQADNANAWNVLTGQDVKLIFTPNSNLVNETFSEFSTSKVIDVEIYSIKDVNLYVNGELEYNPEKLVYITFVASDKDAIFIASAKDKGSFNIIQ